MPNKDLTIKFKSLYKKLKCKEIGLEEATEMYLEVLAEHDARKYETIIKDSENYLRFQSKDYSKGLIKVNNDLKKNNLLIDRVIVLQNLGKKFTTEELNILLKSS